MRERLRLFVACELSEEIRAALARLQADLRRHRLDNLRWVRPQGIHLTLKFLGETPAQKVAAIEAALAAASTGVGPFALSLGEVGTFGDRRGPRVIWVDVSGELETLAGLQKRVETAMGGLGFTPEQRPFSPHLTLARVPPEHVASLGPRIQEAIAGVQVAKVAQTVTEVSLMRSILQPGGAVYQKVAAWALG